MSQENVEIVRMWFAGLAEGTIAAAPELWHPDLIIDNTPDFPIPGPYHGYAGLERWWNDLSEVIEQARIELDEITALDETRVLTVQRIIGVFANTEIAVNEAWVAVHVLSEGKIKRGSGFLSREQALEAVGLPG